MTIKTHNWSSSAHQEFYKIVRDEIFPIVNQVDARLQNFEIQFLKEATKFVGDFKSLVNEADASLAKHKALELEIKRLLKAVVSQDIMILVQNESVVDTSDLQTELERTKECFETCIIKKETKYAKLWNDWYKKCDECKYDKISYDKAYKDMQQKIERLQAQLGDLKGKSKDTSSVSDTRYSLSQKLKNENLFKKVSDQKDNTQDTSANTKFSKQPIVENLSKVGKTNALSNPVTSNSVSTPHESKRVNNDKVIAPGMFRINPSKTSREEKQVPNTVSASARTKPITVSQPPVITKKDVNSDLNGLSKVVCAMYKKCLISVHLDKCLSNSVTAKNSCGKNQKAYFTGMLERQNRTLVEAARTMLIFSRASLFLWAEAIATECFTQNGSIIHRRFNKTPCELINGRKPDISFLHVFSALCYPKNDREDIGKLGAKGDIGFFIGYFADSCAYRIYNRRTKKIMETMNVSFDELSAMAFEQRSSKPELNSMTSRHISLGLDLTYAPSTITMQQPSKCELDLLFEAMYDDYICGQLSATGRTVLPAQEPQDVDELNPNAMVDGNTFVNPFANSSTSAAASSSSQNVDPSNMHTFYQPYPHEFQWTKDHPLEQVIGEPSRPVLTRNQL
nr:retrovirus-related Pol polyprotein from transposon TNT 1-94 [Tanacetum cinerariifolium]